jgi:phage pi2 protein 07
MTEIYDEIKEWSRDYWNSQDIKIKWKTTNYSQYMNGSSTKENIIMIGNN